jgi:hypothetical protein
VCALIRFTFYLLHPFSSANLLLVQIFAGNLLVSPAALEENFPTYA